jgi:hypothetical protein
MSCAVAPRPQSAISATAPAPPDARPLATDANPRDTLPYLASDALEGRGIALPGLDRAADFLAAEFAADGLKPLPGQPDYFQRFDYTPPAPAPETALTIASQSLKLNQDFTPMRFSAQGKFSGDVVFAGYGISAPQAGYDDYAGLDVRGKVVLVMRFEPADQHHRSRLLPADDPATWSDRATFASKISAAAAHGAAALLIVDLPSSEPDALMPFSVATATPSSIPVLQITRSVADRILSAAGAGNLASLGDSINSTFHPHSIVLAGIAASGKVQIKNLPAPVKNVMACLAGAGPHADEFVVVGAHYDHLGLGGMGLSFGPPGSIYHGADDNASGVASVLELARRLAHAPPPPRSIIFICFTAEEEGLIGSAYFVNHPPVPLSQIVAMLNMDMVGRIKDQTLYIGGQGTARHFDAILANAGHDSPLQIKSIGRGGMGPSDHMSFALKRIPVLFFFSGLHRDYHRPTDVASKINYDGLEEVTDFSAKVITGLAQMPHDPYVVEADKDSMRLFGAPTTGTTPERRVILGVIPDYTSADSRVGVLIAGTTPDTPAEAAGLQGGDLLVQFNQQKLQNLMDLTEALAKAKPGDKIHLKVIRGPKTLLLDITLAERKG